MSDADHGERLVRIETKIDTLIESKADQEKRLRRVENRQWWAMGAAAACSYLLDLFRTKH